MGRAPASSAPLMTASAPHPKSLRVLIVGLNYAPEPIGIAAYTTGLAEHFARAGHRVEVIAGRPYYPQWRAYPGFEALAWKRSVEHGVALTRCPHHVPAVPTGARRILHHLSFAAAALPVTIARVLRERPDVVLCVMPSLVSAVTARIGAWLGRAPLWLHVQDFEVDAALATGLIGGGLVGGGLFERALRWLEGALFKSAATVSTISPAMVERLRAKGVAPERTRELRNWAIIAGDASGEAYRRDWGLAGRTVALYAGSIGRKQGAGLILEAARLLKVRKFEDGAEVAFVICGEGPDLAELKTAARDLPAVQFRPLQPAERLGELLALADLHLLPQIVAASDLVLPSKLTNMLASGRPTIATAAPGSGLYDEIDGCGIAVPPDDAAALAAAIAALAADPAQRSRLGEASRHRARERWSAETILSQFEQRLVALAASSNREIAPENRSGQRPG